MSEHLAKLRKEARLGNKWEQHRFLVMVFGVTMVALVLVVIALRLYANSTAIELDLSLPSREAIREQVSNGTTSATFPSTGTIDKQSLDAFRKIYGEQYDKIVGANNFGGEALTDQALGLPAIK